MTQKDQRVGAYARAMIPALMGIIAVLFSSIPMKFPISGTVAPSFTLMIIYFWSIHRPDLLQLWLCFVLGLFLDLISGAPIGMNALFFVICRWIMLSQRRLLGTSFAVLWLGFVGIVLGEAFLTWLIQSFLVFEIQSIKPVLYKAVISTFLFPVVAWILVAIHRTYLQSNRGNNG